MEIKAELCGIPGTLTVVPWGKGGRGLPGLFMHQKWVSDRRTKTVKGEKILMHAEVRFDDNCKNGHNSFAVTGHGWYDNWKSRDWDFGGCCHDMIEVVFPELKHLIKWHFMSSDSPMHYVANTVYHASNLHNGKAAGEPNQWENRLKFGAFPITFKMDTTFLTWLVAALKFRKEARPTNPHMPNLEVVAVPHPNKPGEHPYDPHYSFDNYTDVWSRAPFRTKRDADEFAEAMLHFEEHVQVVSIVTGYSPGKERDFDAARSCAIWPEATDEQLSLPKEELTALLEARLPQMVADFKAAIASTGCFEWEAPADA